jgi:starch synthase (maltosyl-transferring)
VAEVAPTGASCDGIVTDATGQDGTRSPPIDMGRFDPMIGRIPVTDVSPVVSCGRWPAKAAAGERLPFQATVFREGHDAVSCDLVLVSPSGTRQPFNRMRLIAAGTDRWETAATVDAPGEWTFWIEAWSDPLGTWRHDAEIKIPLGQDVELVFEEGARLHERAAQGVPESERAEVLKAVAAMRDRDRAPVDRLAPATDPRLVDVLDRHPLRDLVTESEHHRIWVDRERALFGSWYEFFPRSEGAHRRPDSGQMVSGTFRTAMDRLPAVAEMGFDIVYLPPIHPIGRAFRKGPNNTLDAGPDDPGSPWAIGGPEGGHDSIHPDLGSFDDFDEFVARTRELGMEVALDLALQASPDHPWAAAHPEWFTVRADGSIAYAENPPKKYQDIYPVNFDNDPDGIYHEVLRVVRVWISHGVKVFRVDNPHTKPVAFWEWLIAEVKKTDPDVIWLAEAFTRPAMMQMLAKIGFTQSYTYFTWRTEKWEIEDYLTELSTETVDFLRPNFFVNTPDILHAFLQYGGPAAFKIRAVLAAMTSPSWGVYSGYELYEHVAVRPGSEEYLDSEKYQYRPRDWAAAARDGRTLAPYLTQLNRLRRQHPALQRLRNITLHEVDNDLIMAWSKRVTLPDGTDDIVLVVLNLDPHAIREATVRLDLPALGFDWSESIEVHDELSGSTWTWGERNYVRLDPYVEPAHVFTVRRVPS